MLHVRHKYWILRGREVAKKHIRKCVVCKRIEGLPFKFNVTPDLPEFRVSDDPPFTHTGIDFAGPLITTGVFNTERSEFKSYICLFTCASTRAVHLELVEALGVNEFIRCFRRFSARRGLPSTLISDNAKTFKAMSKEVKNLVLAKGLHTHLESRGIKLRFILDRSPWQGGMWERLIRSVKRCIVKIVGRAMLSFMELSTLLVEIESVINARPLTYIYDDVECVSFPLSPSHLMNGRNVLNEPSDNHFAIVSNHETLPRRAKYHRTLLTQFAQRWKKEYLLSIMDSYKGKQSMDKPVIEVGDIVVLRNDGTKRSFWKLGKIVKLFTGADGHTRGAKVEVSTGKEGKTFLNRPLQHLVPLEVNSKTLDKRSLLPVQSASTGASSDANGGASSDAARNHIVCDRPRRNAAIIGQMRSAMQCRHEFV